MHSHQTMASYVAGSSNYRLLKDDIARKLDAKYVNLLIKRHNLELDQLQGLDPEPDYVLQCMEDKGIFSERNLKTLSNSLMKIGKPDLAQLIGQFEKGKYEPVLEKPKQETDESTTSVDQLVRQTKSLYRTSSDQTAKDLQNKLQLMKSEIEIVQDTAKLLQKQLELFLSKYEFVLPRDIKTSLTDASTHAREANHLTLSSAQNLSQDVASPQNTKSHSQPSYFHLSQPLGTLPEVSNPHNHTQQQEWPPRHENKKPKSFSRH